MLSSRFRIANGLLCVWLLLGSTSHAEKLPDTVSFNAYIRPIMSNTCFACHGPDEENSESGFRIDSFDAATRSLESDESLRGIVPGDPDASEVYLRITGQSDGKSMPPEDFRHQLDDDQKQLFRRWIEQGAPYEEHWSYSPLRRPEPPSTKTNQSNGPIDDFILARLESEGLGPSESADKRTLLRRLYLDLHGLPPTPKQVQEFLDDPSPDAYERIVERLLDSPHYGERMAISWLDLVRFADTVGFHGDQNQRIFPYRDYVIDSFNQNKPFDQFTREQIAGDLLDEPTGQQLIATGFLRLNMMTREGGAQAGEYLAKYKADRVRAIGTAWLGSTLGCCECHNHKYDPFTAKDFYSLGAFFDDLRQWGVYTSYRYSPNPDLRGFSNDHPFPPELKFKSPSLEKEIGLLQRDRDESLARLFASDPKLFDFEQQRDWLLGLKQMLADHPDGWVPLNVVDASTSHQTTTAEVLPDGSVRLTGQGAKDEVITIKAKLPQVGSNQRSIPFNSIRVEVLPDAKHDDKVGRGLNGSFALSIEAFTSIPESKRVKPAKVRPRYVRISLPGKQRILTLAEVQVFAKDETGIESNIAQGMPASQSSTYRDNFPAKHAVDGNTDGDANKAQSITHAKEQTNPWWEVDLESARELTKVVVWNRTDGDYQDRLTSLKIELLDEDRQVVSTLNPKTPRPSVEVIVPDQTTPPSESKIEIGWSEADRKTPRRYSQGRELYDLDRQWKSGSIRWQLPDDETSHPHTAVYHFGSPRQVDDGQEWIFRLATKDVGRVRLSLTPIGQAIAGWPAADERLATALNKVANERSAIDQACLDSSYYRSTIPLESQHPISRQYQDAIAKLHGGRATTLVVEKLPDGEVPVSRVLPRGNWQDQSGELAPPAVPHFLPQPEHPQGHRLDRLDLANWLVSPENPLTARHFVNRIWQQFFGSGISETLDDLGSQGQWPSHPELLDWLATEFIESGWDVKHLVRQVVLSRTYQQAAAVRSDLAQVDPYNRLLAQQSPRRLEAEIVRDNALAAAGLLSLDLIGGTSVFPYQPAGHYRDIQFPDRKYRASTDIRQYRRGIYMHWQRTFLHPMLVNFDAPSRDECTAQRSQSNSPQQALTLLNDPTFAEASRVMAATVIESDRESNVSSWLKVAFERALSRSPRREEIDALQKLFERQKDHFAANPSDAKAFLGIGLADPPGSIDLATHAAMAQVCRVILNLHETITRY